MLSVLFSSLRLRRVAAAGAGAAVAAAGAAPAAVCRTCLRGERLRPIFERPRLARQLYLVTGLVVKKGDGLPQTICSSCRTAIRDAVKFRKKSKKANETLRSASYKTAPLQPVVLTSDTRLIRNESVNKTDNSSGNDDNDNQDDNLLFDGYGEEKSADQKKAKPTPVTRDRVKPTPGKPFKCKTCSKEFRMKSTYLAHVRFHTNYFICELCGKPCRSRSLLQLHRRGRHALGRVHACALCPYAAASREGLVNHSRRHTGERPYACDACGAAFARRSSLLQHLPVHLDEKRFQCEQCPKRFHSKKFLASHVLKAHTPRRYSYVCPACARAFSSPDACRKHQARAHGTPRHAQGPVPRVPCDARAVL